MGVVTNKQFSSQLNGLGCQGEGIDLKSVKICNFNDEN